MSGRDIKGGVRLTSDEAIGELVKAKDAAMAAEAIVKQFRKENAALRAQRDEAIGQLDTYLAIRREAPLFKLSKPSKKSTDSLSVPIFIWSDWHCEEEIKPDQVRGLNSFNLDIASERIDRLGNKSVAYAISRKSEVDIPEAIVWLGGDFLTGYIHEEFMPSNQLSPPDAILWVKSRLRALIEYVAQNFPKVRVVCNVGNHGRTTKKKWISNSTRNSFEWLMYHCLADEFRLSTFNNVEFFIPDAYFAECNLFDFPIRFHHGDHVMYKGGVGGPSIPINKAISEWNVAERVAYDYFGHLHQFIDHHQWLLNGSLIGYSPFSIAIKGKFQRPLQVVDFVHHRVGRTDAIKVYLD